MAESSTTVFDAAAAPAAPADLQRRLSEEAKTLLTTALDSPTRNTRKATASTHIAALVDGTLTGAIGAATLKTVRTVVRNAALHSDELAKFGRLRTTNDKIRAAIVDVPDALALLAAVGFVDDGEGFLVLDDAHFDERLVNAALGEIETAWTICKESSAAASAPASSSLPKGGAGQTGSRSGIVDTFEMERQIRGDAGLTNRQRNNRSKASGVSAARRKEEEERAEVLRQMKADKAARADPDWKPAVSAARDKTGNSISTFRDRYGEDKGG